MGSEPEVSRDLVEQKLKDERILTYNKLSYSGFSQTFSARDLENGRSVAIKRIEYGQLNITKGPFSNKLWRLSIDKRLRNEIIFLRKLPASCFKLSFMFTCHKPSKLLVVSELCNMDNLFQWVLQQHQPILVQDIIGFMQCLLHALEFFHTHTKSALNLSPERILFRNLMASSLVLAPNISIVETLNELQGAVGRTEHVECWSPERIQAATQFNALPIKVRLLGRPNRNLSKQSDLWTAMVLFYFLISGGDWPFQMSENAESLLEEAALKIRNIDVRQLVSTVRHLNNSSQVFKSMFVKCFELDPGVRPSMEMLSQTFAFEQNFDKERCVKLKDSFLGAMLARSSKKLELFALLTDTES
ncbi:hypothetical protein Ciccas_008641 [Cichlidogyrus casuarinus]|uniref:Protein kinase domain-containing protein n=1 Tax=Cichlidogyrus casuarinus TaxID=1844966 RepID=A0ABD2Q078_9PLAT